MTIKHKHGFKKIPRTHQGLFTPEEYAKLSDFGHHVVGWIWLPGSILGIVLLLFNINNLNEDFRFYAGPFTILLGIALFLVLLFGRLKTYYRDRLSWIISDLGQVQHLVMLFSLISIGVMLILRDARGADLSWLKPSVLLAISIALLIHPQHGRRQTLYHQWIATMILVICISWHFYYIQFEIKPNGDVVAISDNPWIYLLVLLVAVFIISILLITFKEHVAKEFHSTPIKGHASELLTRVLLYWVWIAPFITAFITFDFNTTLEIVVLIVVVSIILLIAIAISVTNWKDYNDPLEENEDHEWYYKDTDELRIILGEINAVIDIKTGKNFLLEEGIIN